MIKYNDYEYAHQRAINVLVYKEWDTQAELARALGVSKQFIRSWCDIRLIPANYACKFSRMCGVNYGLLRYEDYVYAGGDLDYVELVLKDRYFSKEEKTHILGGKKLSRRTILDAVDSLIK